MERINVCTWDCFKMLQARKVMNLQYACDDYNKADVRFFDISGPDHNLLWVYRMDKQNVEELAEFVANYLPACNYAVGDNFTSADDFVAPVAVTADAHNMDYDVIRPHLMVNGGNLVATGIQIGDWIEIQVVDVYGAYYPEGTVVKVWGRRALHPSGSGLSNKIVKPFRGNLPVGFVLRAVLHRCNTDARAAGVNFYIDERAM